MFPLNPRDVMLIIFCKDWSIKAEQPHCENQSQKWKGGFTLIRLKKKKKKKKTTIFCIVLFCLSWSLCSMVDRNVKSSDFLLVLHGELFALSLEFIAIYCFSS